MINQCHQLQLKWPLSSFAFWASLKFWKEEHSSFLHLGAVDQCDLQNVTKIKGIVFCVKELEPKMMVNLGVTVVLPQNIEPQKFYPTNFVPLNLGLHKPPALRTMPQR